MSVMAARAKLTRLSQSDEGRSRYFHPNGYVIESERRSWSERVGAMRGQAGSVPLTWWTVYHHIARRQPIFEERPAAFLGVTSVRFPSRDFATLAEARVWCDEHPREGWSA